MYKYYSVEKIGKLNNNAYIVVNQINEGIIIDPSFAFTELRKVIQENGIKVKYIILTHLHYDHYYDVLKCARYYNISNIHFDDRDLALIGSPDLLTVMKRENINMNDIEKMISMKKSIYDISIPNMSVIHTPGHSPGSISLLFDNQFIFTGDTLFRKFFGPVDLYLSDKIELIESCAKLLNLNQPETIIILPGHGKSTTLMRERKSNKILGEINEKNINW
jgi:hydroxyacylglutathione hydrolase